MARAFQVSSAKTAPCSHSPSHVAPADVVGMLRAAQAAAGEVLGAAAVSVGVRCVH